MNEEVWVEHHRINLDNGSNLHFWLSPDRIEFIKDDKTNEVDEHQHSHEMFDGFLDHVLLALVQEDIPEHRRDEMLAAIFAGVPGLRTIITSAIIGELYDVFHTNGVDHLEALSNSTEDGQKFLYDFSWLIDNIAVNFR